jgi:hypothetical protein
MEINIFHCHLMLLYRENEKKVCTLCAKKEHSRGDNDQMLSESCFHIFHAPRRNFESCDFREMVKFEQWIRKTKHR